MHAACRASRLQRATRQWLGAQQRIYAKACVHKILRARVSRRFGMIGIREKKSQPFEEKEPAIREKRASHSRKKEPAIRGKKEPSQPALEEIDHVDDKMIKLSPFRAHEYKTVSVSESAMPCGIGGACACAIRVGSLTSVLPVRSIFFQVSVSWEISANPAVRGTLTIKEYYSDFPEDIEFEEVRVKMACPLDVGNLAAPCSSALLFAALAT